MNKIPPQLAWWEKPARLNWLETYALCLVVNAVVVTALVVWSKLV